MTNIEKARAYIAQKAEADGELMFAREVRAGCWDHRSDVQRVLKRFSSTVLNWEEWSEACERNQ